MDKFVEIVHTMYYHIFPFSLEHLVKKEIKGYGSICDVGCGEGGFTSRLISVMGKKGIKFVGCDIYAPFIHSAEHAGIYDNLVMCDIRRLPFKEKSFDVVMSINSIEHIPKDYLYIDNIEKLAKKRIVITTTSGYLYSKDWGIPTQKHLCGYEIEEFKNRGYSVYGWESRFFYLLWEKTPAPFNLVFSLISHLFTALTYYHLRFANGLICVKDLKRRTGNE